MRISSGFGEGRAGDTSSRIDLYIVIDSYNQLLSCSISGRGHNIVRPVAKCHVKEHQVLETNSVRKMLDLEVYETIKGNS